MASVACTSSNASSDDSSAAGITAASRKCDQSIEDKLPPRSKALIVPARPVVPFYQWESNDGYCGETSMIQAGMNNGQWTSQFTARLLCGAGGNSKDAPTGTSLSQSGPDGFCAANRKTPDINAQLLLESTAAANADGCLSNFRLQHGLYDTTANVGMAGYKDYMSWIKAQMIAGHQVTIGVLLQGGDDPIYDHIVTVMKIGTNHSPTDPTYFDDDVLFIEDHGAMTYRNGQQSNYPSNPPGAGTDKAGCTPYVFGYPFSALPKTRVQANADSANAYAILIPGATNVPTKAGGDGVHQGPAITMTHNYGFAVSGPALDDPNDALLPITLTITGSKTNGKANPADPLAGFNYESPHIGNADDDTQCTNAPPASWMSIDLEATVSGLTPGVSYNLYEYDFDAITGVGSTAALDVPTVAFNANASKATKATPFVAQGDTFSVTTTKMSNQTVVFRAVPADAP